MCYWDRVNEDRSQNHLNIPSSPKINKFLLWISLWNDAAAALELYEWMWKYVNITSAKFESDKVMQSKVREVWLQSGQAQSGLSLETLVPFDISDIPNFRFHFYVTLVFIIPNYNSFILFCLSVAVVDCFLRKK